MRIIAGIAKGRTIKTLKGLSVRPTSDKVRGAIFNILGAAVVNANVLDLFSGTGALGIEALSRGASKAVFIDRDIRCIKDNLMKCGFIGEVIKGDVYRYINKLDKDCFHIVFADPPYGKGLARKLLQQLDENSILKNFSFVVIEHSKRDIIEEIPAFLKVREKKYGDTIVSVYKRRRLPQQLNIEFKYISKNK